MSSNIECLYCVQPILEGEETRAVGSGWAHAGCQYPGSNQYLFDTWIHPVLDHLIIQVEDIPEDAGWDILTGYLKNALREHEAEVRHKVAEEIRAVYRRDRHDAPDVYSTAMEVARLVHPQHGEENNCTDFHP